MNNVFSKAVGTGGLVYARSLNALSAGYGRYDMTGGVAGARQRAEGPGLASPKLAK